MKVLIVEDDAETAAYIINGLSEYGHVADHVANGRDAFFVASTGSYDVAIVDRMLPVLDGLSLVRQLRGKGIGTAVLFLTNLGGLDDRVEGLNAGGDDYLVKPFAFSEVLARVNALARRPAITATMTVLRCGDLEIDLLKRSVRRGGHEIDLQPQEFRLLEFLARHADHVVTRTMLLEMVWDFHFDPMTNFVETHIKRLREKIDHGFECKLIRTVQGAGYMLGVQGTAS
ncbi:MAG: response regulator transcription factor [Beijerinckiaceae bacterium]|nr:MAG: response regulator transcription factor [Beijerinckiaceae bacterium]